MRSVGRTFRAECASNKFHSETTLSQYLRRVPRCIILDDSSLKEVLVDYELAYVARRAVEERKAAQSATCQNTRERHLILAQAFEEHLGRLQYQSGTQPQPNPIMAVATTARELGSAR